METHISAAISTEFNVLHQSDAPMLDHHNEHDTKHGKLNRRFLVFVRIFPYF